MSTTWKVLGVVLIVLAVPLLFGALILVGSQETFVPDPMQDRTLSGILFGGTGVLLLVLGTVLLLLKPRKRKVQPAAQPAGPARRQVEIKRTEMNVGSPSTPASTGYAGSSPDLDAQIESLDQEIARLKVQFGMGQIDKQSFARMRDELEKEKAELELRRMEEARR